MTAADMRRQRWVRVSPWAGEWKLIAVLTFVLLRLVAQVDGRDVRIRELEAQVQRLTPPPMVTDRPWYGQRQSHGSHTTPALTTSGTCDVRIAPELAGPYIRTHATSQQGPVVYSCGGKNP